MQLIENTKAEHWECITRMINRRDYISLFLSNNSYLTPVINKLLENQLQLSINILLVADESTAIGEKRTFINITAIK